MSSFLNIRVADIQTIYKTWTERDAHFLTPPIDRGQETRCYLRDPDGHLIEVGQTNRTETAGGLIQLRDYVGPVRHSRLVAKVAHEGDHTQESVPRTCPQELIREIEGARAPWTRLFKRFLVSGSGHRDP